MNQNNLDKMTSWNQTVQGQRSYLCHVMHWFYYRPSALKSPWMLEEPLVWELYRALDILPQHLFVIPLLELIGKLDQKTKLAITSLLAQNKVSIIPYPSLGLQSHQINCRSDLGFGINSKQFIWIEAKTAQFSSEKLLSQLRMQEDALQSMNPNENVAVVALVPDGKQLLNWPCITWGNIMSIFQLGLDGLQKEIPKQDIRLGYERIAIEIIDRIRTHPKFVSAQSEA